MTVQDSPGTPGFRDLASADLPATEQGLALLDLTPMPMIVRDVDGVVRLWNHAAEEVLGFTQQEAVGRILHELLATEFPSAPEAIHRELTGSGTWEGPLLHRSKDGRRILVSSLQVVQRTPDGEPNAILEIAEPAEPESEAPLVVPREAMGDRLYIVRPERDAAGEIVGARPVFVGAEAQAQQAHLSEHLEQPQEDWWPGFAQTRLFELIKRVATTGEPVEFSDVRITPPWVDEEYVIAGRAVPFGDDVAVRSRDVTVERRALQKLDDSQARVRLALQVAPVAVLQTDLDLRVGWIGGSIGLAAQDPDRVLGEIIPTAFMDPQDEPRFLAAVERVRDTGADQHLEIRFRRKGTPEYMAASIAPRHDDQGAICGFVLAFQDISEHRRLIDRLRVSQQQLRAITRNTPDAIWLKDAEGRYTFVNEALAALVDLPADEIVGRTDFDVLPYPAASESARQEEAVRAAGTPLVFESTVEVAGAVRELLTRRFPVHDRYGGLAGVGGSATDRTEQVHRDRDTQRRAAAMRAAGIGLMMVRERDQVIVEANEEFCALFGYEAGELIGRHVAVLNVPADGEERPGELAADAIIARIADESRATVRVRNIRRDGTPFWGEATIVPAVDPEHGRCFITAQRDIADQVALEERLAAAEARLAEHGL